MSEIIEKVMAGDVRAVAKLIRDIDDGMPGVRDVLKELHRYTGNAHVVGITGAPGVGKSTLVDQIVSHLRAKGKTVGVIAVDPTSPFSGGAILGDRVRMQRHSTDPDVFIRSLATRGQFGGLTQSTRAAVDVLDAMGKDCVLLETVGVGQDEVDVMKTAHTTVVTVIPGMGDGIQAIKAGILEVGDIFVINKADREGVESTENDLNTMLEMGRRDGVRSHWKPPVFKTQAVFDIGVGDLVEGIESHREHLRSRFGKSSLKRDEDRVRGELLELVKNRLVEEVLEKLASSGDFDRAVQEVASGGTDPYTACDDLLLRARLT